jgi:hypothetical protein
VSGIYIYTLFTNECMVTKCIRGDDIGNSHLDPRLSGVFVLNCLRFKDVMRLAHGFHF